MATSDLCGHCPGAYKLLWNLKQGSQSYELLSSVWHSVRTAHPQVSSTMSQVKALHDLVIQLLRDSVRVAVAAVRKHLGHVVVDRHSVWCLLCRHTPIVINWVRLVSHLGLILYSMELSGNPVGPAVTCAFRSPNPSTLAKKFFFQTCLFLLSLYSKTRSKVSA